VVQTASSLLDEHTREAIQLFDTISLLKRLHLLSEQHNTR